MLRISFLPHRIVSSIPFVSENNNPKNREAALQEAMRGQGAYVFHCLHQLCSDNGLIDEIAQDVWCHVYDHFPLENFTNPALLKRKCYQKFVDAIRKKKVRDFVSYTEHPYDLLPDKNLQIQQESPDEPMFYERFWEQFKELELTETQQTICWMHYRYGYTMKEISSMLDMPSSSVHDQLKRLRSLCTDYLNQKRNTSHA